MAFWDDIFDFGKTIASNAWDFAKENPATAGAIVGGTYNALNNKNVVEGAGVGALLGWGANQAFGGTSDVNAGSFSSPVTPNGIAGPVTSGASGVSAGNFSIPVNTTTLDGITAASSGATQAATGGDFGLRLPEGVQSALDWTKGAVKGVQKFGQDNKELAQLGVQGLSYLNTRDQNARLREQQDQLVQATSEAQVKNDALADTQNATAAAYDPQRLGLMGMSSAYAAGGRDVATLENNTSLDPTAKAALQSKARVNASKNAGTAFATGYDNGMKTQAGLYRKYDTPTYQATLYKDMADQNASDSASTTAWLESLLGNPSAGLAKKKTTENGVTA